MKIEPMQPLNPGSTLTGVTLIVTAKRECIAKLSTGEVRHVGRASAQLCHLFGYSSNERIRSAYCKLSGTKLATMKAEHKKYQADCVAQDKKIKAARLKREAERAGFRLVKVRAPKP